MGATTIVVGRDRQKCERVTKKIRAETANAQTEFLLADLSSQKDIFNLAKRFREKYEHLDVLINNAGALFLERRITVDEIEMTFALNHLAYFLMSRQLLDCLKSAGKARIVNVASEVHRRATLNFDDIQFEKSYFGKRAYSQSKLFNILFSYELADQLKNSGVTVNAMAPGSVFTNFGLNNGWLCWAKNIASCILSKSLVSAKKGADTVVYLATSPQTENVSGKYFADRRQVLSATASYEQESRKRLWELSLKLTAQD